MPWLCCEVGGLVLALPVQGLREILRAPEIFPLPLCPPWVRGAINLRGSALPVLDLAQRLGLTSLASSRRASVIVFAAAPSSDTSQAVIPTMGLWVDRVFEIMDVDPSKVEAVPVFGNQLASRFISLVLRWRDQPVLALDMNQVLESTELATRIGQHAQNECAQRLHAALKASTHTGI